ncbi:MAG: DNA-formamidopyrimidine glycosylase [Chroococcidiopsidaceae cyanobacterium CP_BM_ER_R8_30]|nr:DNA-formamidopyrimidine glycosylase [Chroococcidiopsidaceae cyanobacterium CP_BM_ER_R8_30]
MPELPEVETVRQGLNQVTLGYKITGGDVLLARTIAYPLSLNEFLAGIKGTAITQWHRRGKYLLAELVGTEEAAGWLGVHLRMTGQLLWLQPGDALQKHTRVRLFFAQERELRFVDQRTFGQIWWVPPGVAVESVMTGLGRLGLEPFSAEFSVEHIARKLHNRRRPIKSALLDQMVVAGLGNIYADEALFLCGVRPVTLCTDLQLEQIESLRNAIVQVLQTSIAAGGTTFSNFLNVQGINGNYGGVAWVYNRTGEPCRICGTPIQRLKLAGRSAHFCPQCQHDSGRQG